MSSRLVLPQAQQAGRPAGCPRPAPPRPPPPPLRSRPSSSSSSLPPPPYNFFPSHCLSAGSQDGRRCRRPGQARPQAAVAPTSGSGWEGRVRARVIVCDRRATAPFRITRNSSLGFRIARNPEAKLSIKAFRSGRTCAAACRFKSRLRFQLANIPLHIFWPVKAEKSGTYLIMKLAFGGGVCVFSANLRHEQKASLLWGEGLIGNVLSSMPL